MKVLLVLVLFFLTACGGGGGSSVVVTPPPVVPPISAYTIPEGVWTGMSGDGLAVKMMVLKDGTVYSVFTLKGHPIEMWYGKINFVGGAINGLVNDYFFSSLGTQSQGLALTGSYLPKVSLTLPLTQHDAGSSLVVLYDQQYDLSPVLANLAGSYKNDDAADSTTLNVDSSGTVIYQDSFCQGTSQATPSLTGKNIFDVTFAFQGAYCNLRNTSAIVGSIFYNTTDRTLVIIALDAVSSSGVIYTGVKQ